LFADLVVTAGSTTQYHVPFIIPPARRPFFDGGRPGVPGFRAVFLGLFMTRLLLSWPWFFQTRFSPHNEKRLFPTLRPRLQSSTEMPFLLFGNRPRPPSLVPLPAPPPHRFLLSARSSMLLTWHLRSFFSPFPWAFCGLFPPLPCSHEVFPFFPPIFGPQHTPCSVLTPQSDIFFLFPPG